MILIRPRAWWFNKVPLSVLLFLLLIDGRPFTGAAAAALCGLIAVVCCVANYGYALNEAFDLAEDRRGGRKNFASEMSTNRIWTVIVLSAVAALAFAGLLAGIPGLILTACELLLPLAYSIPPLRLKERGWLGVFADAGAAHVFPALLALLIVSRKSLVVYHFWMAVAVVSWAAATGLRGILSHQLQSEEHDRGAGLLTVVHRIGHARLKAFVMFGILPVEVISFVLVVSQADVKIVLKVAACLFLIYEYIKFRFRVFAVIVFDRAGDTYIPFVDEGFYKVWGPCAIAADAAFADPLYLMLLPLCCFAFWPRVNWERTQIAITVQTTCSRFSRTRRPGGPVTGPVH